MKVDQPFPAWQKEERGERLLVSLSICTSPLHLIL